MEKRAAKELSSIGHVEQQRIIKFIRERLVNCENPRDKGAPLSGSLSGLWRYRVGDCRLIANLEDEIISISIIRIGNRGDIYRS